MGEIINAPAGFPFFPAGSGTGPSGADLGYGFDPPKRQTVDLGKKGSFTIRKGALHRALGVPEDETIPASKLAAASHSKSASVRRMAASAKGLKAMHKGGS